MIVHASILAIAGHGEWWEIIGALATPAIAVCGYIARKSAQLGQHLERQDERHAQLSERVARLEGPVRRIERSVSE